MSAARTRIRSGDGCLIISAYRLYASCCISPGSCCDSRWPCYDRFCLVFAAVASARVQVSVAFAGACSGWSVLRVSSFSPFFEWRPCVWSFARADCIPSDPQHALCSQAPQWTLLGAMIVATPVLFRFPTPPPRACPRPLVPVPLTSSAALTRDRLYDARRAPTRPCRATQTPWQRSAVGSCPSPSAAASRQYTASGAP